MKDYVTENVIAKDKKQKEAAKKKEMKDKKLAQQQKLQKELSQSSEIDLKNEEDRKEGGPDQIIEDDSVAYNEEMNQEMDNENQD